MKIFGWEKNFDSGIDRVDNHNKLLSILFNRLLKLIIKNENKEEYNRIFNTIKKQSEVSFNYEEQIMKDINYPQYQLHKNQHAKFLESLDYLNNQYLNGENNVLEFQRLFQKWFDGHILVADKRYHNYLNKINEKE